LWCEVISDALSLAAGKPEMELSIARDFQRKAQFYLDFVEVESSSGFHAAQETAPIPGESIDFSRQGHNALAEVPLVVMGLWLDY
jgi:nitrite reductase (cytochrome c-552)